MAPDQQLVPFSLFTDPELPRVGLSEKEAKAQGIAYRLFKIPMEAAMRASTMSENTANAIRTLTHSVKTEAIVPGLANPQRQFTLLRKTR